MPTKPTMRSADPHRHSGVRVLVWAASTTAGLGLVAGAVGGLVSGSAAALGVLVGALIAVLVFAFGSFTVNTVAGLMPAASLLFALLTYALQVLLLLVALVAIERAGLVEDTLDRVWLVGGIIGGTLVWMVAQVVWTVRARIPVYDLPTGGAGRTASTTDAGDR
ncbi:hypothetical protein [Nocardioides sp. zg-DK7169]|uniref:hypothetical protein n=1 Tax=Nocardioides sp. zg-DK7169 TaxID=2736600 RepID=UPI001556FF7F|nr:hypothetical protein [Nocardioides sp. zg-DK7169]NPC98450.1 hypothetical protein [Nocardioides sp. zg-DK7169]